MNYLSAFLIKKYEKIEMRKKRKYFWSVFTFEENTRSDTVDTRWSKGGQWASRGKIEKNPRKNFPKKMREKKSEKIIDKNHLFKR